MFLPHNLQALSTTFLPHKVQVNKIKLRYPWIYPIFPHCLLISLLVIAYRHASGACCVLYLHVNQVIEGLATASSQIYQSRI